MKRRTIEFCEISKESYPQKNSITEKVRQKWLLDENWINELIEENSPQIYGNLPTFVSFRQLLKIIDADEVSDNRLRNKAFL